MLYGVTNGVVGSNSFIIASGLYGADAEDSNLFDEEEDRQMFQDLYEQCMAQGLNYSFAEEGLFSLAEHYSQSFDQIKFSTFMPYLRERYAEMGNSDPIAMEIWMDEMAKELGWPLFKDNLSVKIKVTFEDVGRGLMRTIGKAAWILVPYALVVYAGYLVLMAWGFKKNYNRHTAWGGFFILIMILGNIAATSFMIFCEPRYLLYNMVPFYVMGYLLLRDAWMMRKDKNR